MEYEENIDFSNFSTDIKLITFYLPQFHIIEENNKFWGEGFTEWINVKKSKPRFKGHHQPRKPGDNNGYLGYYDLTNLKTIETQINLAKTHGIYGFAIYYYWFSGKRLLEKPLNIFIKNSKINFNFLLIWANENWSRNWNGGDKEILIKQEYKPNDPINFIKDIKKYIKDYRYIKIGQRPVLGLYEPKKVVNLEKTIKIWREKSIELGIGKIFILICIKENKIKKFRDLNLFEASYEYPPRNKPKYHKIPKKNVYIYPELLYYSRDFNKINLNFTEFPFFRASMVEWDNCARRIKCVMFDHYSPKYFYLFNSLISKLLFPLHLIYKDLRFIFINAWNEWGEGSYLEPDNKYGYASINALSKAIFNLSYNAKYKIDAKIKISVLVNIDNIDLTNEIINKINNIPYIYDLFIIIKEEMNLDKLKNKLNLNSNCSHLKLILLFNKRGNLLDILFKFRNKMKNYKYICNINSYHYKEIKYFEDWRNYIYNNLLGDSKIISEILTDFEENENLGIIFPKKYYKSLIKFGDFIDDNELKYLNSLLKLIFFRIKASETSLDYPEGNMFWARISAIYPIFKLIRKIIVRRKYLLISQFHLEKIWVFLLKKNGFLYKTIINKI